MLFRPSGTGGTRASSTDFPPRVLGTHCNVSRLWWVAGGSGRAGRRPPPPARHPRDQTPLGPGTHTHTQSSNINSTLLSWRVWSIDIGFGSGSRETTPGWYLVVQICPADVIWMELCVHLHRYICISYSSRNPPSFARLIKHPKLPPTTCEIVCAFNSSRTKKKKDRI